MLSKGVSSTIYFKRICYEATWDWTQISRTNTLLTRPMSLIRYISTQIGTQLLLSGLLYIWLVCTPSAITKRWEKLDNYYTMLCVVLNKSWKQYSFCTASYILLHSYKWITKHLEETKTLYKTRVLQSLIFHLTNHPSKSNKTWWVMLGNDKLISDVFIWTPTHGHTCFCRPLKSYIHRLCVDARCLEDLLRAMADTDEWGERVRESVLSIRLDDDIHSIIFYKVPYILYRVLYFI